MASVKDGNSWDIPFEQRYSKEFPADKTHLAKAWKLLESYSGIPPAEIEAHVMAIREKAFEIFPYPCIGRWRFLDLYVTLTPEYQDIITRLKGGDKLLDVGCCFGHILRQMAFDGAPAKNLVGADLRTEFVELGYELFCDKSRFEAQFVTGDILDDQDSALAAALDGKFDMIHAASFFHLFGWDDQVRVGERLVRFLKTGAKDALVLGRQVGSENPPNLEEYYASGKRLYPHNVESFQRMWDIIGEKTGTKWRVSGGLFEMPFDAVSGTMINFVVRKVDQHLQ